MPQSYYKGGEEMKKYLLSLCLLLTITGCSAERIIQTPVINNRPVPIFVEPQPIDQMPVEWTVITENNIQNKLDESKKNETSFVYVALTPEGYTNLSINVAEMRRYISQLKAMISAYKDYMESSK